MQPSRSKGRQRPNCPALCKSSLLGCQELAGGWDSNNPSPSSALMLPYISSLPGSPSPQNLPGQGQGNPARACPSLPPRSSCSRCSPHFLGLSHVSVPPFGTWLVWNRLMVEGAGAEIGSTGGQTWGISTLQFLPPGPRAWQALEPQSRAKTTGKALEAAQLSEKLRQAETACRGRAALTRLGKPRNKSAGI